MNFKVIVAGGREFNDYSLLKKALDFYLRDRTDVVVVSGAASGADALGERWAKENGHKIERFPADWKKYGKAAGPKRNKQMAEYADAVVVFWDGQSRGTASMIREAKAVGLPTRIVRY